MKLDRSKRMKEAYHRWCVSDKWDLGDVYKSHSREKNEAYTHCMRTMLALNGYGGRIVGYNTNNFSYGFVFKDAVTEKECFVWITKDFERFCPVEICSKE